MYRKFQRQRGPGSHLLPAKTVKTTRVRPAVCVRSFDKKFGTGHPECQEMLTGHSPVTPFLMYAPN